MPPGHVLVTGGAGVIGSHFVDAYLFRGWRVSIIDDPSTGTRGKVNPRAEFHHADLRDPATMPLLDRIRPDLIRSVGLRLSVGDAAGEQMHRSVLNARKLLTVAGPGECTDLRQGVEATMDWFRKGA